MTKGKTPAEIFDMFGGDVDVAIAKVGGSNLPNDLIQLRGKLDDKAKRAFDRMWNTMVGSAREPSAAKIKAFKGYLEGMAKRKGGDEPSPEELRAWQALVGD